MSKPESRISVRNSADISIMLPKCTSLNQQIGPVALGGRVRPKLFTSKVS
jgi:hypothetical protein